MKRLIIAMAAIALIAGVGTVSAQKLHKSGLHNSQSHYTQRNVRLR
jgi:hypothetical protein